MVSPLSNEIDFLARSILSALAKMNLVLGVVLIRSLTGIEDSRFKPPVAV